MILKKRFLRCDAPGGRAEGAHLRREEKKCFFFITFLRTKFKPPRD